ncbi:hypothetical protein YTPLAS18_15270 [Nitrospira sp.]|nr:hypothetical protein YTPLAS18_15270 [Nitrospira sp.]
MNMRVWFRWYSVIVCAVVLGGCSDLPEITRTGKVKNVVIRTVLTPQEVTVRPGDEIRWTNQRMGKVRVEFINRIENQISCNDGFNRIAGLGTDKTAELSQNESASLCFSQAGEKPYVVRLDSTSPSGEQTLSGKVMVE